MIRRHVIDWNQNMSSHTYKHKDHHTIRLADPLTMAALAREPRIPNHSARPHSHVCTPAGPQLILCDFMAVDIQRINTARLCRLPFLLSMVHGLVVLVLAPGSAATSTAALVVPLHSGLRAERTKTHIHTPTYSTKKKQRTIKPCDHAASQCVWVYGLVARGSLHTFPQYFRRGNVPVSARNARKFGTHTRVDACSCARARVAYVC